MSPVDAPVTVSPVRMLFLVLFFIISLAGSGPFHPLSWGQARAGAGGPPPPHIMDCGLHVRQRGQPCVPEQE